ncbi:MAG: metallo-beta-lactamase domain-containing protein [Puniceicoccaceae bacterium 5H]|nr:MAG: metallo-beta-lactamase domain-containing protein [Puniceicoccaceae bacterium 5H]
MGAAQLFRVQEQTVTFEAAKLFPEAQVSKVNSPDDTEGISPQHIVISVHTWALKTLERIILIDTGIGNHKPRPVAAFDMRDTPFQLRLFSGDLMHQPAPDA